MAATRFDDFTDIEGLLRIPRLAGLAAGPDGRLVAQIQQADADGSRTTSSLWELDAHGTDDARRLTWSAKGESAPRFAPDGSLLFASTRPDPTGEADDGLAIWRLPEHGEARIIATAPGGLTLVAVADDGSMLATTQVLAGGSIDDDAERRAERTAARRTTIWHTGMPIRYWDHELGDQSTRLVLVSPDGELRELTRGADTVALTNASADLARDGSTVVTTWTTRVAGGETRTGVAAIDVRTRRRRMLLKPAAAHGWSTPRLSPNGTRVAATRDTTSTPTDTSYDFLEIHPVGGGGGADVVRVDVGDLTIGAYAWVDDARLAVSGDLHSRGAVLLVDAATGAVRTLVDDAPHGALAPAADGKAVFALRSDIASPAAPVRIPLAGRGAVQATPIPAPGGVGALPGRVEWVETDVDGVVVGGWLCTPTTASSAAPAPVMLWIHGGPHGSYNAWSWRWNPWLAVARGWAVLLPDPAMSTGYGHEGLNRGWPRLPDVVWRECETLLDHVLTRRTLDASRTALLGASFGGFMTNWIAGHSDRFGAIVTHAGLWALDQQHATTDAAAHKVRVHGHPDDLPEWYRAYSPHRSAGAITTPMLVTHGNRDYRVPVSEALRLWWDLVSGWRGTPASMPHRFLQLTDEHHWVMRPSNAVTWNETVLAFCAQHVLGADPIPDALPW